MNGLDVLAFRVPQSRNLRWRECSIDALLGTGGPTAVVRFIAAIVIDAIQRVLRAGLQSHVTQKVHERILPTGADSYASAAIALKLCGGRLIAASFHVCPCDVFRTLPSFGCVPMQFSLSRLKTQASLFVKPLVVHVAQVVSIVGVCAIGDETASGRLSAHRNHPFGVMQPDATHVAAALILQ